MQRFILMFRNSGIYQTGQSVDIQYEYKRKMIHWVGQLIEQGIHIDESTPMEQGGVQIVGKSRALIGQPIGLENEVVGGCTLIMVRDLNSAIEIAKGCPLLETNANIEIRSIQKF